MTQYIVSARKYRPQRFGEVVGQEQVTATLKNALKSNHLAQSFLFCGPRGVGKTTCARILAKAVNCSAPSEDMEPCNACNSCKSFDQQASFNIHELDAASNNSVEDMRGLIEQVRFAPQSGKYKVYIIDEVHMLSSAAFNAFLKTLEEPPSYAIFILATTEKHKIIPTILSRCQIFDFKRIEVKDMVRHLKEISDKEGINAEEAGLHIIAQKADGALRDALSIFDKVASFSGNTITYEGVIENLNILDYDHYFQMTEHLLTEDHTQVLTAFSLILARGFEADTVVLGLAEHFRNLLMCKDERTLPLLEVSKELTERYREQARMVDTAFLLNALDLTMICESSYKTAINKRLHVEVSLLKICFLNSAIGGEVPVIRESKKKPSRSDAGAVSELPLEKPAPKTSPERKPEPTVTTAPTEETAKEPPPSDKHALPSPEQRAPAREPEMKADEAKKAPVPSKEPAPSMKAPVSTAAASGDPLQELEAALEKGNFDAGGVEADREARPLTQESVEKAWSKFIVDNAQDLPANFISNARSMLPELREGNHVAVVSHSSVSRGFIMEQGGRIKEYLRHHFHQPEVSFEVELVIEEDNSDKPKQYLNPKEQFKEMAKENPSLIDFQKRFDLDIDYDL